MKLTRIGKHQKNYRSVSFRLTVGKPNYADTIIMKKAKAFPFTLVKKYPRRKHA
jgi:hypothetical protein